MMNSTTLDTLERSREDRNRRTPAVGRAPRAAALARRVGETLRVWRQRIEGRRRLRELDEALLKDMGISRTDALREAAKPFWKP